MSENIPPRLTAKQLDFVLFYSDRNKEQAEGYVQLFQRLGFSGGLYDDNTVLEWNINNTMHLAHELMKRSTFKMLLVTKELDPYYNFHQCTALLNSITNQDDSLIPIFTIPQKEIPDHGYFYGLKILIGLHTVDTKFEKKTQRLLTSEEAMQKKMEREQQQKEDLRKWLERHRTEAAVILNTPGGNNNTSIMYDGDVEEDYASINEDVMGKNKTTSVGPDVADGAMSLPDVIPTNRVTDTLSNRDTVTPGRDEQQPTGTVPDSVVLTPPRKKPSQVESASQEGLVKLDPSPTNESTSRDPSKTETDSSEVAMKNTAENTIDSSKMALDPTAKDPSKIAIDASKTSTVTPETRIEPNKEAINTTALHPTATTVDPTQTAINATAVDPTKTAINATAVDPTQTAINATAVDPTKTAINATAVDPTQTAINATAVDPTKTAINATAVDPTKTGLTKTVKNPSKVAKDHTLSKTKGIEKAGNVTYNIENLTVINVLPNNTSKGNPITASHKTSDITPKTNSSGKECDNFSKGTAVQCDGTGKETGDNEKDIKPDNKTTASSSGDVHQSESSSNQRESSSHQNESSSNQSESSSDQSDGTNVSEHIAPGEQSNVHNRIAMFLDSFVYVYDKIMKP